MNVQGKDYILTKKQYHHRTSGLLKEEFNGKGMAILSAKTNFCWGGKDGFKGSLKGGQKSRFYKQSNNEETMIRNKFEDIIFGKTKDYSCINKGFRLEKGKEHRMITYEQEKVCLSFWHDKSILNPDGVTLSPTPL